MPKVWEEDGFRFYVYYNDHAPAHMHVEKAEGEILFFLGDARLPPSLREVRKMSFAQVKKALGIALREQRRLLGHWRRIHGA